VYSLIHHFLYGTATINLRIFISEGSSYSTQWDK
jgi:hypothetical protein